MGHIRGLTSLGGNPGQPYGWMSVVVSMFYMLYIIYKIIHMKEQFCNHNITTVSHGNNCNHKPLALILGL